MKKFHLFTLLAALLLAQSVFASWDLGLDLRARFYTNNNLPNDKYGESGSTSFGRFRTRVWGAYKTDDFGFYLRLANEFRDYYSPESSSSKQRFPDVLFIDNLYVETKDLLGALDIRLGRQNLSFGSKRIISEGTPGDGSRGTAFDGLRITWKGEEKRTLDAFAFYQSDDDWLPTAGKTHANGKRPGDYDLNGLAQDEFATGLYWQDRSNKNFDWDAYYVAKFEYRDEDSKFRSEGKTSNTQTLGFRLLPVFSEKLKGEVEAAIQAGDHGHLAGLAYSGLTYVPRKGQELTLACLYLTGDSDGPRGEHSWKSVYNRESFIGEADSPMYSKSDYTNLVYPHLAGKFSLGRAGKLNLQAGPMFAGTSVNGRGQFRGFYGQAKWSANLEELLDWKYARNTTLSVTGEALRKGNYFDKGKRDTALLGRVELTWKY